MSHGQYSIPGAAGRFQKLEDLFVGVRIIRDLLFGISTGPIDSWKRPYGDYLRS